MAAKKNGNTTHTTAVSLNKISFWLLVVMTVLYLVAMILSLAGLSSRLVGALQGAATALAICVIAVLAWRYVRNKPMVWRVPYAVVLLVVLLCIVLPLVL